MNGLDTRALEAFIVRAKANTYVGEGQKSPECWPFSHDLLFHEGFCSNFEICSPGQNGV